MKIKDLHEYNKGIQDPNSNAKNSMPASLSPETEKEIAKGLKMVDPTMNGKMAAKGLSNQIQGKKPTPGQLQQKSGIDIKVAKAVKDPALRNQMKAILKKADEMDIEESTLAKKILKKLTGKKSLTKFKKRSKLLKEADPTLFEINFNKKEIATGSLELPIKCGFEAETYFYNVERGGASDDVDNMSISDIEYEYGDLPDQAYEDYQDWLYQKGQDEYIDDLISDKVHEVKEDEDYLNDFIDSSSGPSSEAIEQYKEQFEEDDPKEYENREEDGWEYMNWVREYVEEEYEDEYLEWLDNAVREEYNFEDEARELAEGDYSMEDWVYDTHSYMSSFLDDYGYDYSRPSGDVEGVADELHTWVRDNSEFDSFPETGEYGDTSTTTSWAVETDSSIDPDEGAGAELISPVFDSPKKMLKEMKSLFDWSETNFGTNNSTGLHVTMSWHGKNPDTVKDEDDEFYGDDATGPNKLKMALLLGDPYLLAEFGRLKNSYTKSQYNNVLKYAEGMKRGDAKSFEEFEKLLTKGIDSGKFNSIHFKGEKDRVAGTNLIEFRIAGGVDYQEMYDKVAKAVVRYATIMQAGYEKDAYKKDYVNAVFRLLRKSQEIDPKKLKDLLVVNHEIIDSAKGIVGKKDYFDVINFLSNSVESLRYYEELSKPGADKEWLKSVKEYEKNTGTKFDIKEEEIQGYIAPDNIRPSKGAASELKKAQEKFASAVTIIARDIADGNNRGSVSAKDIGAFRKYANSIKLDDKELEKIVITKMDDFNWGDPDRSNIKRLKKGIDTLFKRNIISEPEYLTPQDSDRIATGMWQFYQSDDVKDNAKTDELAELFMQLNPRNDKPNVVEILKDLMHQRQQNGFSAKLKGSGWDTNTTLMGTGKITTPGASAELLKFLEPYGGYKHPTSPDHHINIKSDDSYATVFDNRLRQRLRERLEHIRELESDDSEKAVELQKILIKVGLELLEGLKPRPDLWDKDDDGHAAITRGSDGASDLASYDSLERWNDAMDRLVKIESEISSGDKTYNFTSAYDDFVIGVIHLDRYFSWKESNGPVQSAVLKQLHKERFASIKKFLSEFDKVFQKEGFLDLKAEIQAKNTLDRRNRDFEKNVRDNAKAKLNIPSHSWMYIDKDFYDTITDKDYDDRAAYLDNHLDHFNKQVNNTRVYVIPSSHWSDAEDATNGLELIDTFEKNKNYFHSWRKKSYKRVLQKFLNTYGFSWENLNDETKFIPGNGDLFAELKSIGIEITHKGDSRKGAPGQTDLLSDELTKNPISGEPLNRSSATSWSMNDDDSGQKQFDAFDWSVYPEKMKDVVAKVMKQSEFGSFQVALKDVLQKIVDRKINIDPEDLGKPLDKLAIAAGVEEMDGDSSNSIASSTNWTNLADYLKIERGVNLQGVNLLKKVYDQYDGDHNWRPAETDEDGQNVIGLKRWGAAVKEAEKYIKDNYNVSAGNYFRKNADGSDGDDVSSMYGDDRTISTPPENEFDSDYDKARADHPGFDRMMQRGMQNYLARGSVNDLVGFLNNPDNDNVFKSQVLNTITNRGDMENGPFASFHDALAVTRRQGNESIFDRFDKLSLQEQLDIIRNSKILNIMEAKKPKMPKQNNPVAKNSRNMSGAGAHKSPKDYNRKKMKADIRKELGEDQAQEFNNVFEQFEKLSLEKQLELLRNPVAEKFFEQDWNNPTNDELERERQGAEKFVQDRKEEELLKQLKKDKKYDRARLLKKYTKLYGQETAEKMIWSMAQQNKFESLIGIDILSRTKKLTENMPNNNKLNIIKGLLSKHFPVGDIAMQFKAYTAMPIPSMMNAFSQLQSVEGPDACAREILTHFCKHRLPDAEIKKLNLKESYIKEDEDEDRLNSIMKAMQDNPNFAKRVYKMLKLEKGSEDSLDIEDRLTNQDTGKENDHRINKNILRKLVTSLEQLDHDFDEINAFVETYGHADYVNTELLNKSGVFSIKDMLVGSDSVSKEFIFDLYESLFDFRINISGSNRGPGELGLCLLSPNVELASIGDIKVNGEEIEVKGEVSSGGGRMVNGIDDFKFSGLAQVKSQLVPFYEKHDIPEEFRIYNLKGAIGGGRNQGQAHILDQAQQLEQIKQGVGAEFLKLITSTYQFVIDSEEETELTSSFMNMDKAKFLTLVGRMSFKNYAYMLNKKGFNRLVFLNWRHDKVVNCTTEEFSEYSDHLAFTSLDMADSQNGPAVQVSVKK